MFDTHWTNRVATIPTKFSFTAMNPIVYSFVTRALPVHWETEHRKVQQDGGHVLDGLFLGGGLLETIV